MNLKEPHQLCNMIRGEDFLKEEAVVFLDSGVGGLPYLSWIRERLKGEHWLYLADHQGFPYGDKEPEELISRLKKLIITVQRSLSIRLMVLACNTASVIALEALRGVFDFPIVGTVPAVKPAAKNSLNGSIAVLATEGTADAPYLRRLIQEHAQDKEVAIIGSNALVDSIENRWAYDQPEKLTAVLAPIRRTLEEKRVDCLVLGCTHFLHIIEKIQESIGRGIYLVDSREGVGNQILRILRRIPRVDRSQGAELWVTGPENPQVKEKYSLYAREYRLSPPKSFPV
jgi:glutamate racemase